jgi:sensor histidine kinase YesM
MTNEINNQAVFKVFRIHIWQILASIVTGIIIALLSYPQGFLSVRFYPFLLIYSLSLGLPFMKIYEYIEMKLEQSIPWLQKPYLRFFVSVLLELFIGIILLILVNWFIFVVIQKQEFSLLFSKTSEGLLYLIIFIFGGILIMNCFHFFKSWKEAAVNEEILKREKLSVEYEALKNQVNPHFLFNSLTALSSLVYKDQEKAVSFIHQFSNVFRYVLDSHDLEVVDFATEKKLLESVSYMNHIRYEDALLIEINLPESKEKYIVPMALQMLLENAIKHNSISITKPLKIEIKEEDGFVIVKNNLQPKTSRIVSNKIGLKNIKSRYKYLSDKEVQVIKSDSEFVVKIPVLIKNHV